MLFNLKMHFSPLWIKPPPKFGQNCPISPTFPKRTPHSDFGRVQAKTGVQQPLKGRKKPSNAQKCIFFGFFWPKPLPIQK
jgi:hypothetical protein